MNMKRFLSAVVVLFLFMLGFETLVRGVLLKQIYLQTPSIWRSYPDMQAYVPFNTFMMVLIAFWITFIFTRLFKEGGIENGLRFGLYFGVLSSMQAVGAYFYLPISASLAMYWFIAYLVESLVGGFLIGLIYRK